MVFEKELGLSLLFDIYSPVFPEKKRELFELYYNDDLSLAEIAEHTGTSRQAVREQLQRIGEELRRWESALGTYKKQKAISDSVQQVAGLIGRIDDTQARSAVERLLSACETQ